MTDLLDFWKLLAGLGLFLFAMSLLESALKKISGKGFRRFLRHSTDKPVSSAFGGIIATAIVQSSSLVSLIVLAFVGAGIIPLVNAIGIVIGSNLGTTFTGWIVTTLGFKINFTTFIYPLLAVGGIGYGLFKGKLKFISQLTLAFALLLFGLEFMKESVSNLTQHADIAILSGYPLIMYLLAGVVFTAIIQSSSATMMLTLSALYAGIIPLPAAAALVIGADLGTTSTVIIGSLQGAVSKRRLAMAHLLFNFFVDILTFILILPLLDLVHWLHITDPLYSLVAFHSLFNLFGLIIFLPMIKYFAKFLEKRIPETDQKIRKYILDVPVTVTDAALEALAGETRNLLFLVIRLNFRFLTTRAPVSSHSHPEFIFPKALSSATKLEQYLAIKKLEGEIIQYGHQIHLQDSQENLNIETESEIIQLVDNLISASRSGIYSAKALKDIDQDLELFHNTENKIFAGYFNSVKENASSIQQTLYKLLLQSLAHKSIVEELESLKLKSHDYHQFSENIYKEISTIKMTSLEISTLLNVNNELETSTRALINSLNLI